MPRTPRTPRTTLASRSPRRGSARGQQQTRRNGALERKDRLTHEAFVRDARVRGDDFGVELAGVAQGIGRMAERAAHVLEEVGFLVEEAGEDIDALALATEFRQDAAQLRAVASRIDEHRLRIGDQVELIAFPDGDSERREALRSFRRLVLRAAHSARYPRGADQVDPVE